ncbi:hypothetical protein [Sporosarcina sp. FA9]|uniref:hypothetical protein n=1 Tax=Sporosarcina sp. FA9 TaxID=3413030 RepID=UPI003F65B3A3
MQSYGQRNGQVTGDRQARIQRLDAKIKQTNIQILQFEDKEKMKKQEVKNKIAKLY